MLIILILFSKWWHSFHNFIFLYQIILKFFMILALHISMSCTRPSSEAPCCHRILEGGGEEVKKDMPGGCYRKQPPLSKSDHLMLLRVHTHTDCSLPVCLRGSRVNNAFFLSFSSPLPDIQSQTGVAWLLSHSQLAKMNCATHLSNNFR
jgi:hypothetical protein